MKFQNRSNPFILGLYLSMIQLTPVWKPCYLNSIEHFCHFSSSHSTREKLEYCFGRSLCFPLKTKWPFVSFQLKQMATDLWKWFPNTKVNISELNNSFDQTIDNGQVYIQLIALAKEYRLWSLHFNSWVECKPHFQHHQFYNSMACYKLIRNLQQLLIRLIRHSILT
jgi:hypothetical protein